MSKVTDLDSKRPHLTGPARCLHCDHEWIATAADGSYSFQCPECKLHKGTWEGLIRPQDGTAVYECKCGSSLFWRLPNWFMCAKCGQDHKL